MTGMNKTYDSFACVAPSLNTGYTAHFVRQNRLTSTSYSPRPLYITLCFGGINE